MNEDLVSHITLRDETERAETVEAGWNTLVGCDPNCILQTALAAYSSAPQPLRSSFRRWPSGGEDGQVPGRMEQAITRKGKEVNRMVTEYIEAALEEAKYELIQDEEPSTVKCLA